MDFPQEWHPYEIARTLRACFRELEEDFAIRYPESRKRRTIELEIKNNEDFGDEIQQLLHEWKHSERVVSVLDLPLLTEWNERFLQLAYINRIQSALYKPMNDSDLVEAIRMRLSEILTLFKSQKISDDLGFWLSQKIRWQFAPLREEADYLLERLDRLSPSIQFK